jgi:hypothetical protein
MNNWSPERRRKFAALVVGTLIVLAALWWGGIVTLQGWHHQKQTAIDSVQMSLRVAESAHSLGPRYQAEAETNLTRLRASESLMARGDLYRWVINHVLDFQEQFNVTVTSFQPPKVADLDLPPAVPYKAATYSFSGTARYHDLGEFLAYFENTSPFIRLRSLTLQTLAPGLTSAAETERLVFQLDFTTLVTTNSPPP